VQDSRAFDLASGVAQATNAAVRSAVPILWHEYTRDQLENSPAGMRVSAKSLPPEVKTVRLVEIQGVDLNPCCGTHVPTTAALQMVKFLKAEPVRSRQFRSVRLNALLGTH
jgi:misacylated tRNA(Ala) deacylase